MMFEGIISARPVVRGRGIDDENRFPLFLIPLQASISITMPSKAASTVAGVSP